MASDTRSPVTMAALFGAATAVVGIVSFLKFLAESVGGVSLEPQAILY
ncbi:hypothetical protein BH24ACT5_BH24ACT5_03760 [soil metagenome]